MIVLTDAFQPEGITRVFQDSVFMMPHLGVLSTVYPEAAWSIFDKDCLVRLGTVIAPSGTGNNEELVMTVELEIGEEQIIEEEMKFGDIKQIPISERDEVKVRINPSKRFDVGEGPGKKVEGKVNGGVVGVILDARGRPIQLPEDEDARMSTLLNWFQTLDLYPEDELKEVE
jgi:hypothetical protein